MASRATSASAAIPTATGYTRPTVAGSTSTWIRDCPAANRIR